MLTISIHKNQDLSRGKSDTALYNSAVFNVLRMAVNKGPGGFCSVCRIVCLTIIYNNDLELRMEFLNLLDEIPRWFLLHMPE